MEQLSIFPTPYRYIIDTSAILSQKPNELHRRTVHKSQWEKIDELIRNHEIVMCSEIYDEVKDEEIKKLLTSLSCKVIEIDDDIQKYVRKIVTECPKSISFTERSGTSSGDAFLIATAMKYNLVIITEENKQKANKIPQVCQKFNLECINILELCEREHWVF